MADKILYRKGHIERQRQRPRTKQTEEESRHRCDVAHFVRKLRSCSQTKWQKKRNTNKQTKRRERETGGDARNQKHANCVQACLQMEKCCAVLISIHLICTENYTTAHWQFQRLKFNYQLRLIAKKKIQFKLFMFEMKKMFLIFFPISLEYFQPFCYRAVLIL